MTIIHAQVERFQEKAHKHRAGIFRAAFNLTPDTKILDLGSETGQAINKVLEGSSVNKENVYIADIRSDPIEKGKEQYGYTPVLIPESGRLDFADGHFDIVYCSSVIEHATVDKEDVWQIREGAPFREAAQKRQGQLAAEIKRVGKGYFVQTPNRYFPIESHCWLPFVGWMPRTMVVPLLRSTNKFWIKKASPDFHLLNSSELQALFPESTIFHEKKFGLTKSIMAIFNPLHESR